jgi:UDP-galactopyranose mutase
VFYIEEPRFGDGPPSLDVRSVGKGLHVAVPILPRDFPPDEQTALQAEMLTQCLDAYGVGDFILWCYTPMAVKFTHQLNPSAVVYDCMDELSAFAGAPPELTALERELFKKADVVFTGGHTLYEAKRGAHHNVHAFPSSVDVAHFRQARTIQHDVADQARIPHPRIGYFGVIDERMDYDLLRSVAAARPESQLVLIGPTAKVDPAALPKAPNIHYLGARKYAELPSYIAGWDVAMLPFARNDATRFISPTKTPEYLAAGKPVVSTSIRDVVRPYGERGLARIADAPDAFIAAIEAALTENGDERRRRADAFLADLSWDRTWAGMRQLVVEAADRKMSRV